MKIRKAQRRGTRRVPRVFRPHCGSFYPSSSKLPVRKTQKETKEISFDYDSDDSLYGLNLTPAEAAVGNVVQPENSVHYKRVLDQKYPIYFNCLSHSKYRVFSNFHGGAEISYQSERFGNKSLSLFLSKLETLPKKELYELLKILLPEKSDSERSCLLRDGSLIYGVTARLIKRLCHNKPRFKVCKEFCDRYGIKGSFRYIPYNIEQLTVIMKAAMRKKFRDNNEMKRLLLNTRFRPLRNTPLRGLTPSYWTYGKGGGNRIGKLLEELREEFRCNG